MATILPVSDLRNYNKVLENITDGNPVYLTVNGRGKYIIYDINFEEEYEQMKAMLDLLLNLREGNLSGEKDGCISLEDVRNYFGKKELWVIFDRVLYSKSDYIKKLNLVNIL